MVQWMDRETTGFTHMGGEGANWIGEAPFSKRVAMCSRTWVMAPITIPVFRLFAQPLAAGTNITYKILYNDAVAMTGGQPNEGVAERTTDRRRTEGHGREPSSGRL